MKLLIPLSNLAMSENLNQFLRIFDLCDRDAEKWDLRDVVEERDFAVFPAGGAGAHVYGGGDVVFCAGAYGGGGGGGGGGEIEGPVVGGVAAFIEEVPGVEGDVEESVVVGRVGGWHYDGV